MRHLISGDLLPPGTRLPPERALAQIFHVNRPTITAALDELRASGLVESRRGSGTSIGDRPRTVGPPQAMSEAVLVDHGINLAASTPADPSHVSVLADSLLLSTRPAHGLGPEGIPALREELAAWHTVHGLPTAPEHPGVAATVEHRTWMLGYLTQLAKAAGARDAAGLAADLRLLYDAALVHGALDRSAGAAARQAGRNAQILMAAGEG